MILIVNRAISFFVIMMAATAAKFLVFVSLSVSTAPSLGQLPVVVLPDSGCMCPSDLSVRENITGIVQTILLNEDYHDSHPSCGPGLWKRIAYINMSDPSQQCPSNWSEYVISGVRSCRRPTADEGGCVSEYFSSGNSEYHQVCGRAIGYQNGTTDAFGRLVISDQNQTLSIDDVFVDGLSLTYGIDKRKHIWTFAAGNSEVRNPRASRAPFACYCGDSNTTGERPPHFIGKNFFCESAVNSDIDTEDIFYSDDPLWDGMNCPSTNCCDFNSPPWFSVELPTSTTDDIEARICCDESTVNENVAITLLELFIQ